MISDAQKYVAEQSEETQIEIKEIRKEVKDTSDDYKKSHRAAIEKLNSDTNAIQIKIDEINKGIAKFTAETGVFEKANILKKQLDDSISELKNELGEVKSYEDKIEDLQKQITRLDKLGLEVNSRLSNYNVSSTIHQKLYPPKDMPSSK